MLSPLIARAQDSVATEPADAGRYQVEMIVFRYLNEGSAATAAPSPAPSSTESTAVVGTSWPPLAQGELRLTGTAARLRRPGLYQLLYHGGWVQPVESRNRAAPTPVPAPAADGGVQGGITLYRERYLHAVVDMRLLNGVDGTVIARIQQNRRLKGQAPQYFDDPEFGLILAVRELTTSPPPADPGAPPPPPR